LIGVVRAGRELELLLPSEIYGTKKPWCQWVHLMNDEKKNVGRPKIDTEAINLRLPRDMIQAIDELRRVEPDLPTRPEMIRRMLQKILNLSE